MKIRMTGKALAASLLATTLVGPAIANEGNVPKGVPHLDHVFVIIMENHGYGQIIGNPNAPFANQYANSANTATNYFAVAHPSLTNYLEIAGGSNFGVQSDNNPDWHNATCTITRRALEFAPSREKARMQRLPPLTAPTRFNALRGATQARTISMEFYPFLQQRTFPGRPSPTSSLPLG